ncbi:hypothetical protein INT48_000411 [Thamnidium elegans]|uniref:HMG box domain-containing protein n=1 Tax=Thamnidium elegans TaxID=101142 RepID=A0A8H7VVH0_9FUNG|nr:hypothetical protein INT48_000411 [Thamnidium elegans]
MSKEERVAKAHQIIASIAQNLTDLVDIFMSDKFTDELPAVEHKKKRRDPNAPKLPTSNFFLFTNSIREEVEKANPDATFAEKSKIYAKEEREKYNKEMAIYEASQNEDHTEKKPKKEIKPVALPPKAAASPTKSSKAAKAAPAAPVAPAKPAKTSKVTSPTKPAKASKTAPAKATKAAPTKAAKKRLNN